METQKKIERIRIDEKRSQDAGLLLQLRLRHIRKRTCDRDRIGLYVGDAFNVDRPDVHGILIFKQPLYIVKSMRAQTRILIAGGGLGGLTAALALLRIGCDVDLYEQAAELKEVGAGLQLSANGTRALHALGVGEALKALSCEAESKEIRMWNTGPVSAWHTTTALPP